LNKRALCSRDDLFRVRNRRELHASLTGATLGDADGDTDDTLKWLKRSKKKEKELAKKRQEELEHMDKVFQGEEYSESELRVFALLLTQNSLGVPNQRTSLDSRSATTSMRWTKAKLVF
jgi:hypothetical protein